MTNPAADTMSVSGGGIELQPLNMVNLDNIPKAILEIVEMKKEQKLLSECCKMYPTFYDANNLITYLKQTIVIFNLIKYE